jgi:Domain of unknown function (DUF4386)
MSTDQSTTTGQTTGSTQIVKATHAPGGTVGATGESVRSRASRPEPLPGHRAQYQVAAASAFLALAALMLGGTAMALTAGTGSSPAAQLAAISSNPWPFLAGGVGLVMVSLFDIFTIPGLHAALGRYGRVLILLASAAAILGDILGIIGRLAQTALVPLGLQGGIGSGTDLLAAGQVLGVLDSTINTAGFLLVSVSFTCFGILMLRGFSRPIGWIAIVAGVFTFLGQIPALAPAFMVANIAYIAWYVGIGRRFWRTARQH